MFAQIFFKILGIAISWFERLVIVPLIVYGSVKAYDISLRVGLQKYLILIVLGAFIIGKWVHQFWIKPFLWSKKEQKSDLLTLFWNYDRIDNGAIYNVVSLFLSHR